MNATASSIRPIAMDNSVGRAEHISLETTEIDITTMNVRQPYRKVRESFVLKSALRRSATELSLLDDDYLKVRVQRARSADTSYTLDLRFLNSQPVRTRRVAWPLLIASVVMSFVAAGGFWFAATSSGLPFMHPAFLVACGAILVACSLGFFGLRATTESLAFTSVHGGAPIVMVVGGLGSAKQGKAFFVSLIKAIGAAKASRQQPKQQWLRDEMREHHRLRELGAISDADYEASKTRILQAHS